MVDGCGVLPALMVVACGFVGVVARVVVDSLVQWLAVAHRFFGWWIVGCGL